MDSPYVGPIAQVYAEWISPCGKSIECDPTLSYINYKENAN